MNKAIVSSIFSITLLSACGGGGTDNNVNTPFLGGVNDLDPIVKLTLKQPRSRQVLSRTVFYTSEGGYEGDIHYVTQSYSDGTNNEIFQLATNIGSLGIKDVQRERSAVFSCTDGSTVRVKIYSDFSSGIVTTVGKHNDLDITCESNFDSLLPATVFDRDSITTLLKRWGADYATANDSTCTHQIEDMNGFSKNCTGEELTNYTITDSTDNLHKLTAKISFE